MNPNNGKTYSVEFVGGQVRISKEHWNDLLKEHATLESQLAAEGRKVEVAVKALVIIKDAQPCRCAGLGIGHDSDCKRGIVESVLAEIESLEGE